MIAIRCYGENSFGGRTQDDFVIFDYSNLEDFKNDINKNKFMSSKQINLKHKVYITIKEDLSDRIVNFSNYLKIKEIDIDLINRRDYEEIVNVLCKHCSRHNGTIAEMWDCGYHPTKEKHCKNFKEALTSKFKRRFKGLSVNERIE